MNAAPSGIVPRADRWRAWAVAGLCLAAALPVALVAWHEGDAATLGAAVTGPPDDRALVLERFADTPPSSLNDRANAALAQLALAEADAAQQPALRDLYLARAEAALAHLRGRQPDGAVRLLAVQAAWARKLRTDPQALVDYAASYRATPFMARGALWRIAYGAQAWGDLSPATRQAMLDEAVWLARRDGAMRPVLRDILGDTPAGMAFALRLTI